MNVLEWIVFIALFVSGFTIGVYVGGFLLDQAGHVGVEDIVAARVGFPIVFALVFTLAVIYLHFKISDLVEYIKRKMK